MSAESWPIMGTAPDGSEVAVALVHRAATMATEAPANGFAQLSPWRLARCPWLFCRAATYWRIDQTELPETCEACGQLLIRACPCGSRTWGAPDSANCRGCGAVLPGPTTTTLPAVAQDAAA